MSWGQVIRVSDEAYEKLLSLRHKLEKEHKKTFSMAKVIDYLLEVYEEYTGEELGKAEGEAEVVAPA